MMGTYTKNDVSLAIDTDIAPPEEDGVAISATPAEVEAQDGETKLDKEDAPLEETDNPESPIRPRVIGYG